MKRKLRPSIRAILIFNTTMIGAMLAGLNDITSLWAIPYLIALLAIFALNINILSKY